MAEDRRRRPDALPPKLTITFVSGVSGGWGAGVGWDGGCQCDTQQTAKERSKRQQNASMIEVMVLEYCRGQNQRQPE